MNLEQIIHRIIETDKNIDADVELYSYFDGKDSFGKELDLLDRRLDEEFETLERLKVLLADTVVELYTGVDVSEKEHDD